ncbi:MAG: biotin/lipoyl-containing protein, partial [Candidatus Puniceispirillaceae bacterium]
MSVEIKVPVLGESVVEATVAKWMKAAGDAVTADEAVVELETDKVTLEVPSPVTGVLSDIVAGEGATVGVDALLALVEEGAAASAKATAKQEAPAQAEAPAPVKAAAPAPAAAPAAAAMPLSPAVRKLVEENNLDPKAIPATGKDGRLT